jgi:hypothetical protein
MPLKVLLHGLAVEYFAGEYTHVPEKVDIVIGEILGVHMV